MDTSLHLPRLSPPDCARHWIAEGQAVPEFATLWSAGESVGRAWVLACLSLARVDQLDEATRRALYLGVATRPRRTLLAELMGRPSSAAALHALDRVDPTDFRREDWLSLFEIASRKSGRGGFAHIPLITRALVEQFDAIPPELRVSKLLAAASGVRIADARWRAVSDSLAMLPESVRASLVRAARRVDGAITLWDYVFRCIHAGEEAARFPVDLPQLGMLFVPLSSADIMRREGLAMSNCMARLVRKVIDSRAVYYRWIGAEPAHVELLRLPAGDAWAVGMMAGRGNAALPLTTRDAILSAMRRALGERLVEAAADSIVLDPPEAPGVAGAVASARETFSAAELERVADALRRIRGRSVASNNGASCIVELPNECYVQFLSRVDRPWYWTEVNSHRYTPAVAKFMTEDAVSFLEECNMEWPTRLANFSCSMPVRSDADCDRLAAFALGALQRVFGHSSGVPLKVIVNIPEPVQTTFAETSESASDAGATDPQ